MTINVSSLGGGGLPLGAIQPLNTFDNPFVDATGGVWLQEGSVETDTGLYPDALVNVFPIEVENTSFSVSSQLAGEGGITWDGSNIWCANSGASSPAIFEYTAAGVYTGNNFSTAGTGAFMYGLTWDGTHFWVLQASGASRSLHKYTAAGVSTGENFLVTDVVSTPVGVTWDGTHFYIVSASTGIVFKYTAAGVYTGESFSILSAGTAPKDIAWDGSSFWVANSSPSSITQFTSSGASTGSSFATASQTPNFLTWGDDEFLFLDDPNARVYTISVLVGVGIPEADDGELKYVKVK